MCFQAIVEVMFTQFSSLGWEEVGIGSKWIVFNSQNLDMWNQSWFLYFYCFLCKKCLLKTKKEYKWDKQFTMEGKEKQGNFMSPKKQIHEHSIEIQNKDTV